MNIVDEDGTLLGYTDRNDKMIYNTDGIGRGYTTRIGDTIYAHFCAFFGGKINGTLVRQDDETYVLNDY